MVGGRPQGEGGGIHQCTCLVGGARSDGGTSAALGGSSTSPPAAAALDTVRSALGATAVFAPPRLASGRSPPAMPCIGDLQLSYHIVAS